MAEAPRCANPTCRRPLRFLAEENGCYVFRCDTCKAVRLISTPASREAGQYFAQIKRQLEAHLIANRPKKSFSFGR